MTESRLRFFDFLFFEVVDCASSPAGGSLSLSGCVVAVVAVERVVLAIVV